MGVSKVPEGVTPGMMLSVIGLTGITAYFSLLELGQPKAGETVLVSGAAGATGSVASQIAKIKGCRVVGIAGGPEKCRWLTEVARLDAAIDYKQGNLDKQIATTCPDKWDVFFDNVGGDTLDLPSTTSISIPVLSCAAASLAITRKSRFRDLRT